MDTNLLETFAMVADAGGLSAAATMMGVPQSIVSRRIKELEGHCKAPLLYRHGRGVKLTAAGEMLYRSARPLLEQFQAVVHSIGDQATRPAGIVSVAVSPAVLHIIGMPLIDEVRTAYPEINVQLLSGYSRYILEWLLQGRIDVGLLSDLGMSTQLNTDLVGEARIVLTARHDFPLPPETRPGEIPLALLGDIPLVVPTRGLGLRRSIDMASAKAGVKLNVAYEMDDIGMVRQLVAAGRAASLLTRLATLDEVARGQFIEKQLGGHTMKAPSVLGTARNRPITPAMKAVIPILKRVTAKALEQYG